MAQQFTISMGSQSLSFVNKNTLFLWKACIFIHVFCSVIPLFGIVIDTVSTREKLRDVVNFFVYWHGVGLLVMFCLLGWLAGHLAWLVDQPTNVTIPAFLEKAAWFSTTLHLTILPVLHLGWVVGGFVYGEWLAVHMAGERSDLLFMYQHFLKVYFFTSLLCAITHQWVVMDLAFRIELTQLFDDHPHSTLCARSVSNTP